MDRTTLDLLDRTTLDLLGHTALGLLGHMELDRTALDLLDHMEPDRTAQDLIQAPARQLRSPPSIGIIGSTTTATLIFTVGNRSIL